MLYGNGQYTYKLVEGWAKLPEGDSFIDVVGVGIDKRDNVYVLNRSSRPIMVFDRQGNLLSTWGEGHFSRPHGLCVAPDGTILCADDTSHTVSKFTLRGKLILTLGTKDKPSDTGCREVPDLFERIASITRAGEPFNRPTGVAQAPSGEIYVSDGYGNARVHKFGQDGKLLLSWGEPGPAPGQFRIPHAVWVDYQERIWVADRENSRIQIFSANGEFITQWTDLIRPTHVFIGNDNIVYASELCRRISIFDIKGKLLSRWGNEKNEINDPLFFAPHTIAVDSKGDIYVGEVSVAYVNVDRGTRAIQKFSRCID